MPIFILTIAAKLYQLFIFIAKNLIVLYAIWLFGKLVCRWSILWFYERIDRVVIAGKKDLIRRISVPTGYSEGFYRVEHYKYVYQKEGRKYRTRVYLGGKFFLPYSFRDTDTLFLRLLNDGDMTIEELER